MSYELEYHPSIQDDLEKLDNSQRLHVKKAIEKVKKNPIPKSEGGYGESLGNKYGKNLTGCCKIKLLKLGIRIVYKVIREGNIMRVIVIAARADDEVYNIANSRVDE